MINSTVQDFNAQNIRDMMAGKKMIDIEEVVYSKLSESPTKREDIVTDVKNSLANTGNYVTYEVAEKLVSATFQKLKNKGMADNISHGMWVRK